jgi:type III pantothenate kinase
MMLMIDVGNTRLKWRRHDGAALGAGGTVVHRDVAPREWLRDLPADGTRPARVLVANVAGPGVAHALGEWSLANWGLRAEFVHSAARAGGVTSSYAHPETLGVDRWLGMIGAWARVHAPLVCLAAGTALTVDAVDAAGHHVGGLIVPGYDLMIDALLGRTAEIAPGVARAAPRGEGLFGCNTAAAVDLGARHALAAVAERAVRALAAAVGQAPRVFLGGGDAERLAPLLGVPFEPAPELVLEGLAIVAQEG